MARTQATFQLPEDFRLDNTHNDLKALACIVAFSPWIGKRAEFPFPVSEKFATEMHESLRIEITPSSADIPPRQLPTGARPGLSFSAGVDSFACLAIMPDDTLPVFSHRTPPPGKTNSLYKSDAPMYAIAELERRGKTVLAVETDIEWVREPVGFGVDPAPAVPLLLLADRYGLDAIAFGTIAEAAYRTGTKEFIDFAQRSIFLKWQRAFRSVEISYFDCVAPMSELCTTQITSESPYSELAQSCVRGRPGKPCMSCVKCFRKSLIESSRTNVWPSHDLVRTMVANRAIMAYLSDAPIRLEVVLVARVVS